MNRRRLFFILLILGALSFPAFNNCVGIDGAFQSALFKKYGTTTVGNGMNCGGGIACLPQVVLDSTYPSLVPGHGIFRVGKAQPFSDCQPAIDAAQPGDEVVIDAGYICSPIILRSKSRGPTSQYVVIRTANLDQLPAQGTRISRSDLTNMAVLETSTSDQAVQTESGASFYQLVGLEIRLQPSASVVNLALITLGSGYATSLEELAHDIVIARSWIHAGADQEAKRGIELDAVRVSLVDSIIDDIHRHGQYSQAIQGRNAGFGPYKIWNNELVSAGEAFSIGSATTAIPDMIPSDIQFQKNYVHKLMSWQNSVTSNTGDSGPWVTSPFMTLNNVQRILVSGNTFENSWLTTILNFEDSGFGFSFWPVSFNASGVDGQGESWVRVQDLTFTDNIIHHVASVFELINQDPYEPAAIAQRLDIQNNLIYDIGTPDLNGNGQVIQVRQPNQGIVSFNHNTFIKAPGGKGMTILGDGAKQNQLSFLNNLVFDDGFGIISSGVGTGAASLTVFGTSASQFQGNVMTGQNLSLYGNWANGNFFPATTSQDGFVADPVNGVTDYHTLELLPTSPYFSTSTDGKPAGADVNAVDAAQR